MADKRRVKRNIKQLQRIKTWQLIILFILAVFIAATFLRLNNIGMKERRDAVLSADSSGDETALQSRMYDLQRYVVAHMNSDTGVFYLEGEYKRESQRRVAEAENYADPNGNVFVKAEAVCKPQFTAWSEAYVQCFADQLAKYPASPNPVENVTFPDASLYRYDFESPLWSSDFAGWTVLVCAAILLMIILRLVGMVILRLLLKRHYRGI